MLLWLPFIGLLQENIPVDIPSESLKFFFNVFYGGQIAYLVWDYATTNGASLLSAAHSHGSGDAGAIPFASYSDFFFLKVRPSSRQSLLPVEL